MQRVYGLGLMAWLATANPGYAAGEAVLHGRCVDAATGRHVPCTVTIKPANEKPITESPSFTAGFRCPGEFTKQVPAGSVVIRITRGFEMEAIQREIQLGAGAETNLTFRLQRRVNMRSRGWYSGDSHAHMLHGERTVPVNFDFVALSARAEDLQLLSLAQAWAVDPATPENLQRELDARSTSDCVLTWNLEAPKNYYKGDAARCLGHCWTIGMRGRTAGGRDVIRALLDASAWDYESEKPTFANFESHALIRKQGGAVVYTHPARWWFGSWGGQGGYPKVDRMRVSNMAVELPLDTVAGPTFDGIDVLTSAGEREANEKAFAIWAMLLNHGYRLAATASSDACFDRPDGAVPGAARTYSYMNESFSLKKATRAVATGQTVATTGPLLIPLIDGNPPGSSFAANGKERMLSIEAWASGSSTSGLRLVEVLRNGKACKQFLLEQSPIAFRTNVALQELENSWYCVRVASAGTPLQLAISSAFYFVDGKHPRPTPVNANVHARVIDASTGKLLPARLVEVQYYGTSPDDGERHRLPSGEGQFALRPMMRLRAEARGYAPVTLSPFLDFPELVTTVTGLSDDDLAKWETYESISELLRRGVKLEFRMLPENKAER